MARNTRSEKLIAEFENGYAKGWFFAVSKAFRDQLDIRKTDRVIAGQTRSVWTQGTAYCFGIGHILYDTPKAYQIWKIALKYINIACQVQQAIPAGVTPSEKGMVLFEKLKPDEQRKKLVHNGFYRTDQVQFVAFLQSGKIDDAWKI